MSEIIRGTTPTITYKITSDVDLTTLSEIWLTVADKLTTAKKTYKLSQNEVTVDNEAKTISAVMSQADTLLFKSQMVQVQIRAKDTSDKSYATDISDVPLEKILEGGVI